MRVRKIQLSDLSASQAYKIRLLREALEQVMGHRVEAMTLSYAADGSPENRPVK